MRKNQYLGSLNSQLRPELIYYRLRDPDQEGKVIPKGVNSILLMEK